MLKLMGKQISTIYTEIFCFSKPMTMDLSKCLDLYPIIPIVKLEKKILVL